MLDFDKDEKCDTCGKRLIDLANGTEKCTPCLNEAEFKAAQTSSLSHFFRGLGRLFSFDFIGMTVEFIWAFQKITLTGDYGKNGRFTELLNKLSSKK